MYARGREGDLSTCQQITASRAARDKLHSGTGKYVPEVFANISLV